MLQMILLSAEHRLYFLVAPRDFTVALGEIHVKQKFPNERSLSRAISHEWFLISERNKKVDLKNINRKDDFAICTGAQETTPLMRCIEALY